MEGHAQQALLAAGALVAKYSARRMLVPFALLAALTNLFYMFLALAGPDYVIFCSAVFIDHVTTALATTAATSVGHDKRNSSCGNRKNR